MLERLRPWRVVFSEDGNALSIEHDFAALAAPALPLLAAGLLLLLKTGSLLLGLNLAWLGAAATLCLGYRKRAVFDRARGFFAFERRLFLPLTKLELPLSAVTALHLEYSYGPGEGGRRRDMFADICVVAGGESLTLVSGTLAGEALARRMAEFIGCPFQVKDLGQH